MPNNPKSSNSQMGASPSQKKIVKHSVLEQHFWGAADLLRGFIDSTGIKHYILGLLFYKRLCDVWEEKYEALLEEFDGGTEAALEPNEHRFHIPVDCRWSEVRKTSTDLGAKLDAAFRGVEGANPRIKGIFQASFSDRFPDHTIESLLQHFELYSMGKGDISSAVFSDAFEFLITQFADTKRGGEFHTPKQVARLMVEILQPEVGSTVYDPSCGSGGILLEAVRYMERQGHPASAVEIYGQEKNLDAWAVCKMLLFLRDIDDAFIERGDTLLDPKHLSSDNTIKQFDIVIANPPFGLKNWGYSVWAKGDPYGRDTYGSPPKSYGDLAFIQHMIASLTPGGRMAVVSPYGVLFRSGAEGKIRKQLIKADLIEAVVGLGPNLFYGTAIPASILLFNMSKPKERKGKVLMVNGSEEFTSGRRQNILSEENIARLLSAVHEGADDERLSRFVSLAELEENDFNLNPIQYVARQRFHRTMVTALRVSGYRSLKSMGSFISEDSRVEKNATHC